MNLDDFDAPDEAVAVQEDRPPNLEEIEAEQTDRMRRYRSARDVIVTPEVARALRDGWKVREIADVLGVSPQTVSRHMKSADMADLIDRESRRVLRHLTKKSLDGEKYRDLSVALGVLIDKTRLLRNEPTEIVREERTSVDRLEILLFGGSGGSGEGNPVIDVTSEPGTERLPGLPEPPQSLGPAPGDGSSDGGDEPGGEPEP